MTKDIFLAGGCFWGTEHFFKQIEGVTNTEVGFANGSTDNPTYEEVYTDTTGYAETVRIEYDDTMVDLEFLLQMFFKAIDPTSLNKQGHDEALAIALVCIILLRPTCPSSKKCLPMSSRNWMLPSL